MSDGRAPVKHDRDALVRCRVCGCTERQPCEPPCGWFDGDLCTGCAEVVLAVANWRLGAHRASWAALKREVEEAIMSSWIGYELTAKGMEAGA